MIYLELKWMHEHPELNLPQWYIRLVFDAEYRLNHGDLDGALHDIQQARTARLYELNSLYGFTVTKDIIYTDTDSSYPLQKEPKMDKAKLRECIQMLGVLQDSLVPCDYVGNDSAILDGITIESANFVLTTAIEILKGVKENV